MAQQSQYGLKAFNTYLRSMVDYYDFRPSSIDSNISTISSDSMVEIKRTDIPDSKDPSIRADDDDKYRLVYSKSKVYVNPTAYARDNIPGFVALVKREAINPIYLLAWIPESLLNERGSSEWDKFVKVEEQAAFSEEDDALPALDVVLIDLPGQRPESYAFSVPLTSIYSLIVNPPSLASWYGSIGLNLINGDTLPTLHFHDDESHSFTFSSPRSPKSQGPSVTPYPPPPSEASSHIPKSITSWGGENLLSRLRNYAHLLRSTLQPSLFLVDPSRADIEAHSTQLFSDDAVDDILAQSSFANSHSPVPAHRRPRPLSESNPYSQRSSVLHRSLGSPTSPTNPSSQARMALLQSFSNITRATRHAAQNILSHPLAKPIVPHLPDPVRSLVNANGEWEWGSWVEKGGVGEFESARVYLARWARIVAEEGERARRKEALALPSYSAGVVEEDSSLGIFELLHSTSNLPTPKTSRDPSHPIDEKTWSKWFAEDGKPTIRVEQMRREVFRRGISPKATLRQKIWPFVLGVLEWDVTSEERETRWQAKRQQYQAVKDEWCGVPDVFDSAKVLEERHRIDVDCRRTDRNQPMFSAPAQLPTTDLDDEKGLQNHYSIISPSMNDIGAQSPSNEHIDRMAGILLTYNFYEKELGYVQGMSDLCAPVYIVMAGNEEMTFWCFVEVMNRMKKNFMRDQSGMKQQLSTLQQLIEVMDPELFRHLEKTDGLNLFFCFRWVLISFKREFPFEDVLRLWEVLWTDYYTHGFVLFVALAILESHRDMILRYLVEFDEILKYCNELSMTIELDSTLAQAEVLFLSFAQIVADIDRRKAEQASLRSDNVLRRRSTASTAKLAGTDLSVLQLSDELRDLLKTERIGTT
ncbi:rab-GTPase-TBC domain-containing protein [Crassisporium funariophilum]|nr:rab-GTPase-TBC domain-containing protein [Crassisporium funariophilum]